MNKIFTFKTLYSNVFPDNRYYCIQHMIGEECADNS